MFWSEIFLFFLCAKYFAAKRAFDLKTATVQVFFFQDPPLLSGNIDGYFYEMSQVVINFEAMSRCRVLSIANCYTVILEIDQLTRSPRRI